MPTESFSKEFILSSQKSVDSFSKIIFESERRNPIQVDLEKLRDAECQGEYQVRRMLTK